jgi:hypothetical protein
VEVEEFDHSDGDGMGVGMEVLGGVVTLEVPNVPYNSLCCEILLVFHPLKSSSYHRLL